MDLATWLRQWLSAHPLKEHSRGDRARYTAEVMERVRRLHEPAPAAVVRIRWVTWPRFALGAAVAVAVVFILVGRTEHPSSSLAQDIEHELSLLASVDESVALEPLDDADLAQDLEALDTLVLAEVQPAETDEAWIVKTLLLLEDVGEATPEAESGQGADEEQWLQDLQLLDEIELSASS